MTSPFITLVNKNGGNAKTTALSPTTIKSENILCAGLKFNWNTGGKVRLSNIMLNEGSTALPYEPYGDSWTNTPHYIHNTSTDTITTPADIYANDNNATVGLKGQMEQSGTPTPTTPIQPSECGERTENLFDKDNADIYISALIDVAQRQWRAYDGVAKTVRIPCSTNTTYAISIDSAVEQSVFRILLINTDDTPTVGNPVSGTVAISSSDDNTAIFTTLSDTKYLVLQVSAAVFDDAIDSLMMVEGSTPQTYEPYGQYKIPILNGSQTTNVYLGEVQTTRKIKKYEFTGQEDWNITNNERVLYTALVDHLTSNELICYCSHYKSIANVDVSSVSALSNGECAFNNSLRWFYIKDNNYNDASVFKTYLQQQYANGTPVTVWYILAEPTTGVVNEPLRKIGNYADEVSDVSIPIIAGANTLSIDTTVQPSEVTATYKGWHPVQSAHEKSAQLISEIVQGGVSIDGSFTNSPTRVRTVLIPVKPNTTYSVGSGNLFLAVGCYYKNSAFAGQINDIVGVTTSATFTVPENVNQIAIGFRTVNGTTNITPSDLQNYMLNEGSTAQPYEPYWT